jgi:hypothetical protein
MAKGVLLVLAPVLIVIVLAVVGLYLMGRDLVDWLRGRKSED